MRSVQGITRAATAILLLWLAFAASAWSADVDGLYETEVPLGEPGNERLLQAVRVALDEVLVKVSGFRDAVSSTALSQARAQPMRYVQQYRSRPVPPDEGQEAASGEELLWVRFDADAVDALLRSAGLPVWGRARPVTLLWLAIEQAGRRSLLGTNTHPEAGHLLADRAEVRGLPLRLPLLDLVDRGALSAADVWGDFEEPILKASARYQTEAVLTGRVYQGPIGDWQARWTLYQDGERQSWSSSGGALAEVLDVGIDVTADALARRFATGRGDNAQDVVLLEVRDIASLADLNRAASYLASLSPVLAAQAYVVQPSSVLFKVTTRSGRTTLARAVELGHLLVPEPVPLTVSPAAGGAQPAADGPAPDLVYRLLP